VFGKKSILKRVLVAYIAFGVAMGLAFPVFADFFVTWNEGMKIIFVIGCILAGLVLGVSNFLILKFTLLKPMRRIAEVAGRISAKDVTHSCSMVSHDTLGEIVNSFNSMTETLRAIVKDIMGTSSSLSESAAELNENTGTTRRDAELQRQLAQEGENVVDNMTNAKMAVDEAISRMIGQTTQAESLAMDGHKVTEESTNAMVQIETVFESMRDQIEKLSRQSEQIGSVVTAIRGIAEQTNLLALNAAIEAARAGEQGRGFAVVAEEVRNLATQTSKSTEEITSIIETLQGDAKQANDSVQSGVGIIASGVSSTNHSNSALHEIASSIESINEEIEAIAMAQGEQNQFADRINEIVHEFVQISERTEQGAELNARETERFNELASHLNSLVADFKT
jgi:methyl-accepting chemotaxis protein